jgi:hypothetical protein
MPGKRIKHEKIWRVRWSAGSFDFTSEQAAEKWIRGSVPICIDVVVDSFKRPVIASRKPRAGANG